MAKIACPYCENGLLTLEIQTYEKRQFTVDQNTGKITETYKTMRFEAFRLECDTCDQCWDVTKAAVEHFLLLSHFTEGWHWRVREDWQKYVITESNNE